MTDSLPSPEVTPWGYKLWKHLHDEHGLTLLESELHEIVRLAAQLHIQDLAQPWACPICDGHHQGVEVCPESILFKKQAD